MNKLQILILIALGISIVAGFIMKMPAAARRGARKRLGEADWLDDNSADGTLVKMTGIARMREQGERFVSPLSDNRCVVLRLRVNVRHGRDPRAKMVEKLEIMPFYLEDQDGKVLVESTHALLDIAPIKESKAAEASKDKVLATLGYEDASPTASNFEETMVEVGASVTVAGKLVKSPEQKIVGDEQNPIAIRVERAIANQAAEP